MMLEYYQWKFSTPRCLDIHVLCESCLCTVLNKAIGKNFCNMGPKKKSKLRKIEQLNKTLGRPVKAVVKQKRDPSKICQLGNKKKSLERRLEELHKSLGRLAEAWGVGETMLGKDQDCTQMRTRQRAKAESQSKIKDFLRVNKNTETFWLYDNQQHLQTAPDLMGSPGEYSSLIQVKQEPVEQPSADQLEFYPYVPVQDEDTERDYNSSIKQECLDDSDISWCDPHVGTSGGSYWNQEDNQRMKNLDQVSSVDQVPIKEESEDENYDANSFVDDNTSELLNRSPQIEAGYLRSGLVEFVSLDNLASTSSTCQISNATLKIPQFIQGQEIGSHSHLVHQSESLNDEFETLRKSYEDTIHRMMRTENYCGTTSDTSPRTEPAPLVQRYRGVIEHAAVKRHQIVQDEEANLQSVSNVVDYNCHKDCLQQGQYYPVPDQMEEMPYVCPECQKCFHYLKTLESHMITHSSEWSHKRTVCGKDFNRAHYLGRFRITPTDN